MTPHVAIIVLNWNNAIDTLACLDSLAMIEYPVYSVLVVDNGSTDDSVAQIKAAWPRIEILATGKNLGYAGGNNVGIRHALAQGADYVCILNNDVTVAPDILCELVGVAEETHAGIVGPVVLDAETPDRVQSAGLRLNRLGDAMHLQAGEQASLAMMGHEPVDAVAGCAMLVSAAVVAEVGVMDERFFMYREEVDWCLRTGRAGFAVLAARKARVWHRDTPEGGQRYVRATYYMTRNAYLLMAKRRAPLVTRGRVLARDLLWVANWSVNPKWRHKRAERDAIAGALRDVVLGQFGKMPLDIERVVYSSAR